MFVNADNIAGALGKDLTKGGKPLNLKDELLALFTGTRIIRIDVKKDLKYAASNMNRLLRAVDENEKFYNIDNYAQYTPSDLVKTFEDMQEEAFRIQKKMHIITKDLQQLDLDPFTIKKIMIESGVNKKLANNIMLGIFTPVNYSKARFDTKVKTIEKELRAMEDENSAYYLNRHVVFPKLELDGVKIRNNFRPFFEPGNEYDPEKFNYKLDKKGNILTDSEGTPIKDEGFIKETLRKVTPIIKDKIQGFTNDYESSIQTPPLPDMPQPVVQTAKAVNPNTNLTRTQEALLSPEEKVIARG